LTIFAAEISYQNFVSNCEVETEQTIARLHCHEIKHSVVGVWFREDFHSGNGVKLQRTEISQNV